MLEKLLSKQDVSEEDVEKQIQHLPKKDQIDYIGKFMIRRSLPFYKDKLSNTSDKRLQYFLDKLLRQISGSDISLKEQVARVYDSCGRTYVSRNWWFEIANEQIKFDPLKAALNYVKIGLKKEAEFALQLAEQKEEREKSQTDGVIRHRRFSETSLYKAPQNMSKKDIDNWEEIKSRGGMKSTIFISTFPIVHYSNLPTDFSSISTRGLGNK